MTTSSWQGAAADEVDTAARNAGLGVGGKLRDDRLRLGDNRAASGITTVV